MTQATLFDLGPADVPAVVPEWRRIPGALGSKCFARWVHRSGWSVSHCGHPTALWPYAVHRPDGGNLILAPNGRGFARLADAKSALLGLLIAGALPPAE